MIGIDKAAFKNTARIVFTIKMLVTIVIASIPGYWFLDKFYEKNPIIFTITTPIGVLFVVFICEYRKYIRQKY